MICDGGVGPGGRHVGDMARGLTQACQVPFPLLHSIFRPIPTFEAQGGCFFLIQSFKAAKRLSSRDLNFRF